MVSNNAHKKNLMEILKIKQELLKEDLTRTTNLIKQIQKSDSIIEMEERKDNLSNRINSLGTDIEKLSKTKKILIIDSNKSLCEMLTNYLIKCGHDCVCAVDKRNGLSLIQKEKFDIILLNLQDQGFNGYDIIDALEKDEKLKENKIFVWTTLDLSQPEIDDLLKRGVRSCIKKPVGPDVLLRTLDTVCQI